MLKYWLVSASLALSACAAAPVGTTFADLYDAVCFEADVAEYVLANDRVSALNTAKNNATAKVEC